MKFLTPLVCGAALIAAGAAHAMTYSARAVGNGIVIDASGPIEGDEGSLFASWLRTQRWGKRHARTIVFDSTGGMMFGGVQMARVVERFGLNTGVAHGGECASACVIAWAAGAHKSSAIDARVGVHMARDGDQIASGATLFYANFVKRRGAPASVVAGLVSTRPSDVYWLSHDELRAWNVTLVDAGDNVLDRPVATQSEPDPGDWMDPTDPKARRDYDQKQREFLRNAQESPPPAAVSVVGASGPMSATDALPILIVSLLMIGGSIFSFRSK